jgi:two-component system response regulator NreC
VRVLCVEDHALLVEGLRVQFDIEGRVRIVGYLPSAKDLLKEAIRLKPHIVMVDIEMPGPDAFEVVDLLHHMQPDLRCIFLSAHVSNAYLSAAYRVGAAGYFSKGDDLNDIVEGVKAVARSVEPVFIMGPKVKAFCMPMDLQIVKDGPGAAQGRTPPRTALERLTSRELEVLRLIGKGLSRGQIAGELSRSVKTVDGHQERMMRKLDCASRAELMRLAIHEGLAIA